MIILANNLSQATFSEAAVYNNILAYTGIFLHFKDTCAINYRPDYAYY